MRAFFWAVTGGGLLLMSAGLFVFDTPIIQSVVGSLLDQWYVDRVIRAAVLGLVVGGIWAALVPRKLRYRQGQSGHDYLDRVAGHGLLAQLTTGLLLLLYIYMSASRASFIPLNPWDRFVEVLFTFKFLGVLGSALAAAGIAYAALTRSFSWGGRYALLRPNMAPSLNRKV